MLPCTYVLERCLVIAGIDFENLRLKRMKQIAYLGRYTGLDPIEARYTDGRWLKELAEATDEIVREENKPAT